MPKILNRSKRGGGFQPLEVAMGKAMEDACHKQGFITHKLVMYWDKIVGRNLAKISSPMKIFFERGKDNEGTLLIGVTNPGFALEIQAVEGVITGKIATYFGYKAISKIKVKVQKITENRSQINNPERKVPEKLSKALAEMKKNKKIDIDDEQGKKMTELINNITDPNLRCFLSELKEVTFEVG